jgi:peroxiredoxin
VQVVAISNDASTDALKTQKDLSHLLIIADAEQKMAKALDVIHPGAGPQHTDTNAPTTILVDGSGVVRWLFRPSRVIERLPPQDVLARIDRTDQR